MKAEDIHWGNGYQPFSLDVQRPAAIRKLQAVGGVEDRLRLVAFAELQARDLFLWGAEKFSAAPAEWRQAWISFAPVENRHAQMLLNRMVELGVSPGAKTVSQKLSELCRAAPTAEMFLFLLASAEERGMDAGFVLGQEMAAVDPISAALFQQIAEEEREHVEMAKIAMSAFDITKLQAEARALSASLFPASRPAGIGP
jgi:uncharacterized ferritin-like protein (DUF455 family)